LSFDVYIEHSSASYTFTAKLTIPKNIGVGGLTRRTWHSINLGDSDIGDTWHTIPAIGSYNMIGIGIQGPAFPNNLAWANFDNITLTVQLLS